MASRAVIEVRELVKYYLTTKGQLVHALQDVTLDIDEGEFVSVVGPSGCGKSTLLKILGGLLPTSAGEVRFRGEPITGPRREFGMVFQNPVLFPWRTVLENALLPIELQGLDVDRERPRAMALLDLVGLKGFEDKYPYELSGGMQQRTAITRALIYDPDILLMDEPFGALDALTREQMNLELLRIWQEHQKTVCFITHSIPEAVFLADRVVALSARPGRILEVIKVPLPRPRHLDMLAHPEFAQATRQIRGLLNVTRSFD